MQKQRIGVVGAGTAGLRCAALLANDSRLDVTILEARDRVGGRIVQDSRMGMPIDMFVITPESRYTLRHSYIAIGVPTGYMTLNSPL